MIKTFVLGLIFSTLTGSVIAQGLRTDVEYAWGNVTNIVLFYSPDNEGYCNMEKIIAMVSDSTLTRPCNWTGLLELVKDWNKEGHDVILERQCIAIEVDFGAEKIVFAVFLEQGVLFDLTENTFQYLNIPDKVKFKELIEKSIK